MAEIALAVIQPAIEPVVKSVAERIRRQLSYLCCFTRNIIDLKDEAVKLDDAIRGLERDVLTATNNRQVIRPEVETWLTNSNHIIKAEITAILSEAENVGSGCSKLGARFSLSKRATKTTHRSTELLGQSKFDSISQAGPPAATQQLPGAKTLDFESRRQMEEAIMTTLRGRNVKMIGIYGMGGLGKTTMAESIRNRVLAENVFQEAAMTVVSQQADTSKIQVEIGEELGLKDLKDETSRGARVKLHARLSDGTKRSLVILDDVWEELELEDLGIPCDSEWCTILITSRNEDALSKMGCEVENKFGMKILSEEEAWCLFREGAGTCVDDSKLNPIAKQVAHECKGLPIALKTLGLALKDKSSASIWNDALRELKEGAADISDYIKKVYTPLIMSYNFLNSEMAKSLFLLCCLFPEDSDIPLEKLTYFCMGLRIFGGIRNLTDARNKVWSVTDDLKKGSLLLHGYDENHVRMHDVIRDVCIYLDKKKGYIGGDDCTWISSSQHVGERAELLTTSRFPNLRLLSLSGQHEEYEFGSSFLEGIKDLYVLCIENWRSFTLVLPTTSSFVNLKTLLLDSCRELKKISAVGELQNLEILICRECEAIEELPLEMTGLNRLKLLELTGCYQLKSVGRGIISSPLGLEDLKMQRSFKRREARDREERESTRGKDCLPQLEELHIEKCWMMQQVFLWDNTEAGVNKNSNDLQKHHTKVFPILKEVLLCVLPNLTTFCQGIEGIEFPLLRKMKIEKCPKMKSIIMGEITSSTADQQIDNDHDTLHLFCQPEKVSFGSSLEVLDIDHNPFCRHEIPSTLFNGLKELTINRYDGSMSLFTLSMAANLVSLRKLRISICDEMIKVIEDEQQPQRILLFPKLEEIQLIGLPKLVSICDSKCKVELPLLREMQIEACPNMKNGSLGLVATPNVEAFRTDLTTYVGVGVDVAFHGLKELSIWHTKNPWCDDKISVTLFIGLEELDFFGYRGGSMSLFSSSAVGNLVNLRVLKIGAYFKIVKVIEDKEDQEVEEKVVSGGVVFPKLEELYLNNLWKLVRFCEWKCDVELPSLTKVEIRECPNMENFSMGIVAAPNLKFVVIDGHNGMGATKDLNEALQQHYSARREKVLEINHNPFCGQEIPSLSVYNRLEVLRISKCVGSMSLFTLSVAANLVSLTELSIENCDEMIKVIEDEEQQQQRNNILLFPKLEILKLKSLPKLVSFCDSKCEVELPSLRKVDIFRFPNMENFSMGLVATPKLERFMTDLSTYVGVGVGVNVAFHGLKELMIWSPVNPWFDDKISVSLFNGLEKLKFWLSDGSMSLFSSSAVGNLVNLRVLKIESCYKIVKVIEDKEDEEEEEKENGKVVSGGVVFPKLEELYLWSLIRLVRFCEWKCDVQLPSLKEVEITNCPDMENFSIGFVAAPNVKMIKINDEYIDVAEDLNDAVLQYLAREKRRKKKKGSTEQDEIEEDGRN